MELAKLYRHRFEPAELPRKLAIWRVLCEDFFARYVRANDVVVDIGAGYCEFINSVTCGRRIAVDLNPDVRRFAAPNVEIRHDDCTVLPSFARQLGPAKCLPIVRPLASARVASGACSAHA